MKRLQLLIPILIFLMNCVFSTAILAQTKDNNESLVEVTEHVDDFYETIMFSETEIWYGFGKKRNGDKVSGKLRKTGGVIYFTLLFSSGQNFGCAVERKSKMEIKLTNSSIVEFIYIEDTTCDNFLGLSFIPLSIDELINESDQEEKQITANTMLEHMDAKMDLLKKYDWEIIRITGTEGYIDFKPNHSKGVGMWGLDSDSLKNEIKNPKLYLQRYYHQAGFGDGAWAVTNNKLQKIQSPEQFFRQHLIAIDQK
jgi:hypothetical protein